MPFFLHFEVFTYSAAGLALLYLAGFWLAVLLLRREPEAPLWAYAPVLGLGVHTILTANLSYLGMTTATSVFVLIALYGLATTAVLWDRRTSLTFPFPDLSRLLLVLVATGLFILPNALYGGFPTFTDAFYYSAVADFLRERSYFASAEPAHIFPWLSQMLAAQPGARMGAQFFTASSGALADLNGYREFIPASAVFLFTSFCGFAILTERLIQARLARAIALAAYGFNVMLVLLPPVQGFMSQTGGLTFMFVTIAALLRIGDQDATWREWVTGGIFVSALISFYPEISPFAILPIWLYLLFSVLQQLRTDLRAGSRLVNQIALRHLWVLAVAVLINPYTWYYTIRSMYAFAGAKTRTGFDFLPHSRIFVEVYYSLVGPSGWSPAFLTYPRVLLGLLLAAIAVIGFANLRRGPRGFVALAAVFYLSAALYYLMVVHYTYAFLKLIVFSYFLVPVCTGVGFAFLLERAKPAERICARTILCLWVGAASLAVASFVTTGYGMSLNTLYRNPVSPARFMEFYEDFSRVSSVPKEGENTLLYVRNDPLARWVPYFFRRPMGDNFKGGYFGTILNRPVDDIDKYQYLIAETSSIAWKDLNVVLFSNPVFTMSAMQTFITQGESVLYPQQMVGEEVAHWMGKRSELLAYARQRETIRLKTRLHLPPDRLPKHLNLYVNQQRVGRWLIDRSGYPLETSPLDLRQGENEIAWETDEDGRYYPGDSRLLSLMVEKIDFERGAPASLNATVASELRFFKGLTPDCWVTPGGIHIEFAKPRFASDIQLQLVGEAFPAGDVLPQTIYVRAGNGAEGSVRIDQPGPFDVAIPIPVARDVDALDVAIRGAKAFRPKDVGVGTDERKLSFRLFKASLVSTQYSSQTLLASKPDDVRRLEGLSDTWVTRDGLRIRFGNPGASDLRLVLTGEVLSGSPVLPQTIHVRTDNAPERLVELKQYGPFEVSVPVRALDKADQVTVRILGTKTFRPIDIGMGQDSRSLAFRLFKVQLRR